MKPTNNGNKITEQANIKPSAGLLGTVGGTIDSLAENLLIELHPGRQGRSIEVLQHAHLHLFLVMGMLSEHRNVRLKRFPQ